MKNKDATNNFGTIINEGYDFFVASRMAGRAGAQTVKGGKGIALEIMYADKLNARNLINGNGYHTGLTKSPIAKQVDLITKDGSKIIERFQCKDTSSVSGIAKTIKQVESGKYNSAQMVGTKETAAAFNSKAAEKGLAKVMKDSGISTKDTSRISNKLNGVASATGVGNIAMRSAKVGGILSGGFAAIESIVNGDDLEDAAANITSSALKGAVSSGVGTAASEGTMMMLAAAPIPLAAKVAIGVGAGIAAGSITSSLTEELCDGVGEVAGVVADGIGDIAFEATDMATDLIVDALDTSFDTVGSIAEGIFDFAGGVFDFF